MPQLIQNYEVPRQGFRFLHIIAMVWIACLLITYLTQTKLFNLWGMEFSVGILVYPITYIFADIFTEVYGYKRTRSIVWSGFVILAVSSLILWVMAQVPPSPNSVDNAAFKTIFANSPIIVAASILGYLAGEFGNSTIMARMKVYSQGKHFWARAGASTAVGQLADTGTALTIVTFIFPIIPVEAYIPLFLSSVLFCILYEFFALPVTTRVVSWLKRAEGVDVYDRNTDLNPFVFK